jgi:AcrR family transcriptional regulator
MTSIRHNRSDEDTILDAARDCILAVGVRRTTMTDVARRAGVSRPWSAT